MLRLAALCSAIVCVLAPAGVAFAAGGPVFAVVPAGTQPASLTHAIRDRLAANRHTLVTSLHTQAVDSGLLRRARAEVAHAADPFPAEDRADRLQQKGAADGARVSRLREAIRRLELALQPVALPAGFTSRSSSAIGSYAVAVAERYLGVRYVWGGGNPDEGFDCSGFVKYAYAQLGIQLPRYAATQYYDTAHIDPSQLEPGDLVFFEPRSDGPGHVGMYVGDDVFIEAPHTGDVVKFARLSTEGLKEGFVGATRPADGV